MKQIIKICLESDDVRRLTEKARQSGFEGRGSLSHYIEKICREPICFLDENVRSMLRALDLK